MWASSITNGTPADAEFALPCDAFALVADQIKRVLTRWANPLMEKNVIAEEVIETRNG